MPDKTKVVIFKANGIAQFEDLQNKVNYFLGNLKSEPKKITWFQSSGQVSAILTCVIEY